MTSEQPQPQYDICEGAMNILGVIIGLEIGIIVSCLLVGGFAQ